jgi:hypothetical protein
MGVDTAEGLIAEAEQLEARANRIDFGGAAQLPGQDSPNRLRERARGLRERAALLRRPRPPVRFG